MALMTDEERNRAFGKASRSGSTMGGRSRADQDPRKEMDNYQAAVTEMKASTGKSNLGMDAHAELSKKHLGYDNTGMARKYIEKTKTKDRHWDDKTVTYGANGPNPLTYEKRMAIDPNHGKEGDDPRELAAQARKHTEYKKEFANRSEAKERAASFERDYGFTPRLDLSEEERKAAQQRGRDRGLY
tara:strand:- start:8028 stop:8585 length:558 start_codon:yes stop_codon:yes gene_type:complete